MTTVAAPIPAPAVEPLRPTGLLRWVTTVDHKDIGILYLLTSLAFGVCGGVEALLIRIQLAVPRNTFLGPDAVRRDLHDARHDDDLPGRHARAAGLRELHRAAADRRARHGVSRG